MAKGEVIGAFALTEPSAGSDVQGIEAEYTLHGNKLILNGCKRWITFGGIADVFIVFGKLDGKPIAALVEKNTPGLTIKPVKDMLGFKASHFSFNIDGGRCEECQGEGEIKVEMQFMADVRLICDSCHGKRFKDEVLNVTYRDRSIFDILEMTINEAIEFFGEEQNSSEKRIVRKLTPLQRVGLGYVKLGQSSSTLSGGESQRIKLAYFLSKESDEERVLFIFDEPTTGLHMHDISLLLSSLESLLEKGHTILVIEHNLEVIKYADWIIDLGPEGGDQGGKIVFQGVPEDIPATGSHTGHYLKSKLIRA